MVERETIQIGTSGWSYKHWLGTFYGEGEKPGNYLAAYAGHFRTAEVNNTFYRLPGKDAVRHWRDTVPEGFTFAVKASRYMTHMKKLKDPEEPIQRLLDVVGELGGKLGPILVQCPPSWNRNPERLRYFLDALPDGYRWAFEFRDPSWFDDEIYSMLAEHNAALCIYNQDGETTPIEFTADWTYLRFHKPAGDGWLYDEGAMSGWAESIDHWAREGRDVYAYFNNDLDGAAPVNAHQLIDLLASTPE